MEKRIFLAVANMGGKEMEYIEEAFSSNWIAPLGRQVDCFEAELAKYAGVKSAAVLNSGTSAIHLALIALGVGKGDTVFCSSLTFVASCNPIVYQGAKVVFIDSEPESFNMSPVALEKAFKEHTPKAVVVVNLYGQSADMDKIMDICNRYNVPMVEDAAESLGATYKGKKSGSFGKFGVYSFNGNKIITTSGGGALISNDTDAINKSRFRASQANEGYKHYQHSELGFNYRLSNVSAAIGRGQLEVLEERILQKKKIYETYEKELAEIKEITMMPICDFGVPNYWLSVMTIDKSSKIKPMDLITSLEEQNIESRSVWKPMHLQPLYSDCEFYSHNNDDEVSVSEDLFNRGVCLPSDTNMVEDELKYVIDNIKLCMNKDLI